MAVFLSIQRRFSWQLFGKLRPVRRIKTLQVAPVTSELAVSRATEHTHRPFSRFQCINTKSYLPSRSVFTSTKLFDDVSIVCPAFAESVTEGDIRWVKDVGDAVAVDEVVAEIETDKTTVTVVSQHAGVVTSILAEDGSAVKPKQPLCQLNTSADVTAAATPTGTTPEAKPLTPSAPPPPSPPPPSDPSPIPTTLPTVTPLPTGPMSSTPTSQIKITPLVTPVVTPAAAASVPSSRGGRTEQRVKMSRMRQRIAARLKEAQNTCAMLTTFNEVDMSNLMALRDRYKDKFLKEHGIKLGFMSAFIKASAYSLQCEPSVNAVIDDIDIVYRDYVDVSVAVATPKGLVVPVLRNVETMNYTDIEKSIQELGEKARTGSLAIEDMDGGTFTVSNGGVFGSMFGTPIINPPQSAILGMHGIFDRPVAISGKVEIRPMMYIALTYDHRLIDGREAVLFLRRVKSAVEDPAVMLLDL